MEGKMEKKHKVIIKTHVLKLMQKGEWKGFVDSVIEEGSNVVNTKKINGYTLLSCAAEYGDKEIVEYLMQNGAESNATNFDGSVPLHIAAKHGHVDLVEFFINLSVCVDSRDYKNRTPLHYVTDQFYAGKEHPPVFISGYDKDSAKMFGACSDHEENTDLVSLLLSHGANIDAIDRKGNVPLLYAVRHNCTDVVEMLIRRGANVSKFWDYDNWTVLHYASYFGWLNVVQCLVETRVNLNAETQRGDTPLLLAAKGSHREVVELLVKSGANVSSRSMLKMTALHFAAQEGWLNVVQLLVEYKADINARACSGATPVMLSIKHDLYEIFKYLVNCGADLVGSEGKTTILHYACKSRWVSVVQSLVDGGSDIDAQTQEGRTPLLLAAKHYSREICDILIKSGASIHLCYSNSNSLLHYACKRGWIDIVQSCVDAGFDINNKNSDGKTPLHLALYYINLPIVIYLLEVGADVNVKTLAGETPLYLAVKINNRNSINIVSYLLEAGADINVKTEDGITPLYLAVAMDDMKMAAHLIEAGADVNVKTADGKTPLYLAVERDYLEIAAYLLKSGANCNEDNGRGTPFECYVDLECNSVLLPLFIQNGACITNDLNCILMDNSYLKNEFLKNVGFCTQAILNKFNNLDLPKIYQVPFAVKNLPPIKGMKIGAKRYVAQCIEESVIRDIDNNGFCNITGIQPIALCLFSAKTFIEHFSKDRND